MNKTVKLILTILGCLLILALIVAFIVIEIRGEIRYWTRMVGLPAPWNIIVIVGSVLLFGFVIITLLTCIPNKAKTKEKEVQSETANNFE